MGECTDHFEREKERLRVVRNGTLYSPFIEYHTDKVPVDVAAFLVVNHVNIGVLCLVVYVYAYVYGKVTDLENI